MADEGWAGSWEPNIIEGSELERLRDYAGTPVLLKNGRPNEWLAVNLRTGEVRYPARS